MLISKHKMYVSQSLLSNVCVLTKNYEPYDKARKKIQPQETKQPTDQTDMMQMLELSHREFKITMINMLKSLKENLATLKIGWIILAEK